MSQEAGDCVATCLGLQGFAVVAVEWVRHPRRRRAGSLICHAAWDELVAGPVGTFIVAVVEPSQLAGLVAGKLGSQEAPAGLAAVSSGHDAPVAARGGLR
jgi:hypothetical protein